MKLKLARLPQGNKGPLIVMVSYGVSENEEGTISGGTRYVEKVALGATIDVADEVGQAVLGQYGKFFEVTQASKAAKEAFETPEGDDQVAATAKKPGPKPKTKVQSEPQEHAI